MEPKDVIAALRQKHGFSQQALADQVFVTRQAVSRWESGETVPGPDTLKLLSRLFNVSINTLLGSPEKLICQCWRTFRYSASAAGCPWRTVSSAASRTGPQTRTTASGAMPTESLPTQT